MTLSRKMSADLEQESNNASAEEIISENNNSCSPKESKDVSRTTPIAPEIKSEPDSDSKPAKQKPTQISPSLAGSKTTLLSARSQIEILNPNEPQENGTFDSKKSPLALLAATCNNIGKDCSPPSSNAPPTTGFPFYSPSNGRALSCSSPPMGELKLPSPLSQHQNSRMRLSSEPEQPPNSNSGVHTATSMPSSISKVFSNNPPPSLLKYMEKLSPISAGNAAAADYSQQLQAKFASALAANSAASGAQNLQSNLLDSYDPLKLAAAIQQAKNAAAAAYMFPSSGNTPNPLSALASLTSGNPVSALQSSANAALSGLNSSMGVNSGNTTAGGCQMCPPGQFIAGGGHSPSKPGAGSPYITFVPVKTSSGSTALVPVCADRGCLNCITAIKQAQLSSHGGNGNSNCNHCNNDHHSKSLASLAAASAQLSGVAGPPTSAGNLPGSLASSNNSSATAAALLSNPLLNPLNIQAALHASPSLASLYQQLAAAHASSAGAMPMDTSQQSPGSIGGPFGSAGSIDATNRGGNFSSPKPSSILTNQDLHRCKWAPIGGGHPCGKAFTSADDLMDHIKVVHMSVNNNSASSANQNAVINSSPTSVSSAIEEANALQHLVNQNRRLSPSVVAASQNPMTNLTLTSTNSFLGSLSSLTAGNPLAAAASLTNSLSRKMPGSLDLASALSAAARYHPYSKFSLPSLSGNSVATSLPTSMSNLGHLGNGQPSPNLAGLTPAGLNALLSSAAASSFLMYDLPKA